MSCTISGVPRTNSMYATAIHRRGGMRHIRREAIRVPSIAPNRTEKAAMMSVLTMPSVKKLL